MKCEVIFYDAKIILDIKRMLRSFDSLITIAKFYRVVVINIFQNGDSQKSTTHIFTSLIINNANNVLPNI